jgi:hypothetical protein
MNKIDEYIHTAMGCVIVLIGGCLAALLVIAIAAILMGFMAAPAKAHEWYDYACCSDKDCRPIDPASVTYNARRHVFLWQSDLSGRTYTIPAGDRSPVDMQPKTRTSKDGQYHGCEENVYHDDPQKAPVWVARCLYLPELY